MRQPLEDILSAPDGAGSTYSPDFSSPPVVGGGRPNVLNLAATADAAVAAPSVDVSTSLPVVAQQSAPAASGSSFFATVQQSATNAGTVVATKAKGFWAWVKSLFGVADAPSASAKAASSSSSDSSSWMYLALGLGLLAAGYFAMKRKPGKSIIPRFGSKAVKIR